MRSNLFLLWRATDTLQELKLRLGVSRIKVDPAFGENLGVYDALATPLPFLGDKHREKRFIQGILDRFGIGRAEIAEQLHKLSLIHI